MTAKRSLPGTLFFLLFADKHPANESRANAVAGHSLDNANLQQSGLVAGVAHDGAKTATVPTAARSPELAHSLLVARTLSELHPRLHASCLRRAILQLAFHVSLLRACALWCRHPWAFSVTGL